MRNRFPLFFLTIVVIQNVPLRMTGSSMATGCDVPEGHVTERIPFEGSGVRMRNRNLRNIRPIGAYAPDVMSSNVT
jgi:hypothetical protein